MGLYDFPVSLSFQECPQHHWYWSGDSEETKWTCESCKTELSEKEWAVYCAGFKEGWKDHKLFGVSHGKE